MKNCWLAIFLLLLGPVQAEPHLELGEFTLTVPGSQGEAPLVITGSAEGQILMQMGGESIHFGNIDGNGLFDNQKEGIAILLQPEGDFWLPKEKRKLPVRVDPDGTLQLEGKPVLRVSQGSLSRLDEKAPIPKGLQVKAQPGTDRMVAFVLGILILTM